MLCARFILLYSGLLLTSLGSGCDEGSMPNGVVVTRTTNTNTSETVSVEAKNSTAQKTSAGASEPSDPSFAGSATDHTSLSVAPASELSTKATPVEDVDRRLARLEGEQKALRARVIALEKLWENFRLNVKVNEAAGERVEREILELAKQQDDWKERIARMLPMIEAGKSAEIGGRTWSLQELERAAEHDLSQLTKIKSKMRGLNRLKEIYAADAKSGLSERDQVRAKFEAYEEELAVVDAKLRSIADRAAALRAAGGSDLSVDMQFKEIEAAQARVNDEVEGQRRDIAEATGERSPEGAASTVGPELRAPLAERMREATN